jgi:hypothetical protein
MLPSEDLRRSKEARISFKDDAGIDVAVVSLSTPGVHMGDSAKSQVILINSRPASPPS